MQIFLFRKNWKTRVLLTELGIPVPTNLGYIRQTNTNRCFYLQLADTGKQFMKSEIERYVPVSRLKYYFAVDTKYVLSKLKLLFFPFTHDVSKYLFMVINRLTSVKLHILT